MTRARHAFTIPERCVSKERPRMTRGGHAYTPKRTREAEDRIAQAYRDSGGPTFEGNVGVTITLYGDSTEVEVVELHEGDAYLPGDVDNYVKTVLDGLQGEGLAFPNDRQVVHVQATKMLKAAE